jgi:transposase
VLTKLFFPDVPGLHVERVVRTDRVIRLVAVPTRRTAACPGCGRRSRRVHSQYARTLADLPCAGDVVTVLVRARRFVCQRPSCPRRIFTERLPGLAAPFARKTARLYTQLQADGVALGGDPGARHAAAEGKAVSARTLLRLVRVLPLPPAGALTVIGVDDWARRKGRTYGTIVVDLERHRVVDLLPDRSAATLASWLQANPGVGVSSD